MGPVVPSELGLGGLAGLTVLINHEASGLSRLLRSLLDGS
jgi:hypothetical protein